MVKVYYIICEGDKNKSEYIFARAVAEAYITQKEYSILPSGGFDNIIYSFDRLEGLLKPGDVVALFLDSVDSDDFELEHGYTVPQLIAEMYDRCTECKCTFSHTTYYCFEELFLSYTRLIPLISRFEPGIVSSIRDLQSEMNSGGDYHTTLVSTNKYDSLLRLPDCSHIKEHWRTREYVSATLLKCITLRLGGNWKISKDSIGKCWISDCSDEGFMKYLCEKCKYELHGCTLKEKIEDLDKNSVSQLYDPFSSLFG